MVDDELSFLGDGRWPYNRIGGRDWGRALSGGRSRGTGVRRVAAWDRTPWLASGDGLSHFTDGGDIVDAIGRLRVLLLYVEVKMPPERRGGEGLTTVRAVSVLDSTRLVGGWRFGGDGGGGRSGSRSSTGTGDTSGSYSGVGIGIGVGVGVGVGVGRFGHVGGRTAARRWLGPRVRTRFKYS